MSEVAKDAVIACSLGAREFEDRRAIWEAVAQQAMREVRPTDDGVEIAYAPSDEVENVLRELARLETECCSFAGWRVSRRGDDLVLSVSSQGDGVAAVRALFDASSTRRPEGARSGGPRGDG